jgi:hypothetical protein
MAVINGIIRLISATSDPYRIRLILDCVNCEMRRRCHPMARRRNAGYRAVAAADRPLLTGLT